MRGEQNFPTLVAKVVVFNGVATTSLLYGSVVEHAKY